MNREDMILISVDDHVVEPPDMFKNHLAKKYLEDAPRLVHNPDGSDTWQFRDVVIPNVALNAVAGRPKEEYGLEPQGLDEIRPGDHEQRRVTADRDAVSENDPPRRHRFRLAPAATRVEPRDGGRTRR